MTKNKNNVYGRIDRIKDGIISVKGLESIPFGGVVFFSKGLTDHKKKTTYFEGVLKSITKSKLIGIVMELTQTGIKITQLGQSNVLSAGDVAIYNPKLNRQLMITVSLKMLGHIVDPLGYSFKTKKAFRKGTRKYVEIKAPGIISRKSIKEPLETGIKIIDSLLPIGRGQRELIIGDRGTGKTTIAVDTILNQKKKGVYCVFVAIGQKRTTVQNIFNTLKTNAAMSYTTIVATISSDMAALQFYAPYSGCAIGEYYRDAGKPSLIVYDDLSKHAVAYRQLSLLLRRPPGREAYPGDIFYVHSRLLERAAKLNISFGHGSLTALPIVETQAGDVSGYIPTNVISITDGQIFLEKQLFHEGILHRQ